MVLQGGLVILVVLPTTYIYHKYITIKADINEVIYVVVQKSLYGYIRPTLFFTTNFQDIWWIVGLK